MFKFIITYIDILIRNIQAITGYTSCEFDCVNIFVLASVNFGINDSWKLLFDLEHFIVSDELKMLAFVYENGNW
jgi:hypothetical protein